MKIVVAILFSLFCLKGSGQDSINNKYLLAIIYLKTNGEINKDIKKAFPYIGNKRDRFVDFNMNNEVWFLPIYFFDNQLNRNSYGIDTAMIRNRSSFKEKYYFEHFQYSIFNKIMDSKNSRLLFTFSKPSDNFLLAEMIDTQLGASNELKIGPSIQFLFIFKDGLIEKVFCTRNHYR